jgi:hypothetical protein
LLEIAIVEGPEKIIALENIRKDLVPLMLGDLFDPSHYPGLEQETFVSFRNYHVERASSNGSL